MVDLTRHAVPPRTNVRCRTISAALPSWRRVAMINAHVIVDGSNIATEGRTHPSLAQLDEAVRAFVEQYPDSQITVVVDATFGHRIDESERDVFEEAVLAGELVSPPAGAIGRGDAFVLTIADRANATVFSNDS